MNTSKNKKSPPTEEFYGLLNLAFDHFNEALFEGVLPQCLLTVQRETNTMGYFSPERWANREGEKAHEIAINPAYFASHTLVEVMQTLVHEQCHLWQQVHGSRKSRHGYHNREWAAKMESIGLMPSQTGEPGGRKTGQQMSDYPVSHGPFLMACRSLAEKGFKLSWVDRIPAVRESCQARGEYELSPVEIQEIQLEQVLNIKIEELVPGITPVVEVLQTRANRNKTKYCCPGCDANVWGKPGLRIRCERCDRRFRMMEQLI